MSIKTEQERRDESQGVFFREQLTGMKATALEKKYPAKMGRRIVPVSNEGGPGAVFRKWKMFDRLGVAKALSEAADNVPFVSLSGQEFQSKAHSYAIAAPFSDDEIEQAQFAGVPLSQMKISAMRDGYEDTVDDLILIGSAAEGIQGLLDHPNIAVHTPGASAGAGDDTWPNKTALEMVADVDAPLTSIRVLSKGTQKADLVLLSIERLALLRRTPMGSGDTNYTVLKHLMEVHPGVIFDEIEQLSTAGVGATQRMIAMQQSADVLDFWEPQPYTTYPEFRDKPFRRVVPAKGRCGGVSLYRPLAAAFMDGI
jgi:hypothetical protein